jgi:hypothetical protein
MLGRSPVPKRFERRFNRSEANSRRLAGKILANIQHRLAVE